MELTDYIAALRRHWRVWLGITAAALAVALVVIGLTPRTYQATAQVFVSSTTDSGSPQFVSQRVTSYPDVAVSAAVLGPAGERLGTSTTLRELRSQVTATNPPDTSQIDVVATTRDAASAAAVANAVATEFADVVEDLEQSASGRSPVSLTVTNPATEPTGPASPQTLHVLALAAVLGLLLGAAAAIVRSRTDTRLHTAADVRALGAPETVLAPPTGRVRSGRPAVTLARRLEARAESGPVRVGFLCPAPGGRAAAEALAGEVAAELTALGVPTALDGAGDRTGPDGARVVLDMAEPHAPLRSWRAAAVTTDGVVLVVPSGRVEAAALLELRTVLADAGLPVLATAVTPRPARSARSGADTAATAGTGSEVRAERSADGVPVPAAAVVPTARDPRSAPALRR
ncbi:YveK family protein [Modestobacter sp. URMC 112]